jgi:hypothetical protein
MAVQGNVIDSGSRENRVLVFRATITGSYIGKVVLADRARSGERARNRAIGVYVREQDRAGLWSATGHLWLDEDDFFYRIVAECIDTTDPPVGQEDLSECKRATVGDGPLPAAALPSGHLGVSRGLVELSIVNFSCFHSWATSDANPVNVDTPALVGEWVAAGDLFHCWYRTVIAPVLRRFP